MTLTDRFWKYVQKTESCWLWTGAKVLGYGFLGRGTVNKAHRVSWTIHNGPIPDGLSVLHRCDVRDCVNPAHLFLGTAADNMTDMAAKGRSLAGTRNRKAKLTDDDVRAIRHEHATLGTPKIEIAKRYGVTDGTIGFIIRGVTWKHIH